MRLIRYRMDGETRLGALPSASDPDTVRDLGLPADPLIWLRRIAREGQAQWTALRAAAAAGRVVGRLEVLEAAGELLAPIESPEVWAAGVTYRASRDARDREQRAPHGGTSPYDRVYSAARPELFLKATAQRLVAPGGAIGLRGDAHLTVPEPEVGLVLDDDGRILGYTLGNDVTARDIEGANPLYLPQAKIFQGGCAIGPAILVAAAAPAGGFAIRCTVERGGETVWEGRTHTSEMRRGFGDLVAHLRAHNPLWPGTVLLTGTGAVPPDDFGLQPGDRVAITTPAVGTLRNTAVRV